MADALLRVQDLCVDYVTPQGPVRAVDSVHLDLFHGEILGVAGESGCGKSTLAKAVTRILPAPAVIRRGQVLFEGRDILRMDEDELRSVRWTRISMVFQSAMDSLNPVLRVGAQIVDAIRAHTDLDERDARRRAGELLEMVGIPSNRLDSYAHQLSGGMRQRIGIALALCLEPSLVILDEPTTALDVIVEKEILQEIRHLQRELGFAVMFITHDLARMLEFSDRVAIFYAAQLVECAPVATLAREPKHPYTKALLGAFPSLHGPRSALTSIPGEPPSLATPPPGCRFAPRCPVAEARCRREAPVLEGRNQHQVACHLHTSVP